MSMHEKTTQRTSIAAKGGRPVSEGRAAATHEKRRRQAIANDAKLETTSTRPQPTDNQTPPKPGPTSKEKQRRPSRNPELKITDPLNRITTILFDRSD